MVALTGNRCVAVSEHFANCEALLERLERETNADFGYIICKDMSDDLADAVAERDKCIASLLAIIDSPEFQAAEMCAATHGLFSDAELATRNSEIVEAAYRLIGKERPTRTL
jgi:hypothetical protein